MVLDDMENANLFETIFFFCQQFPSGTANALASVTWFLRNILERKLLLKFCVIQKFMNLR